MSALSRKAVKSSSFPDTITAAVCFDAMTIWRNAPTR